MSLLLDLSGRDDVRLEKERPVRPLWKKHVIMPEPGKASCLVFLTEPTGLAVEQYKILRRRLCNLQPRGGVLLITSPSPGEGKTLTAVNLAWSLAEAGHKTCLVDLDFRAPGVSQALGVKITEDGVEDVLTGKRTIQQALRQVGEGVMHVLPVKARRASLDGLLSSTSITPLLSELRLMFQWVILDSAPAIPMADVGEVVPHVDGALMIVRSGQTSKVMIPPSLEVLGSKLWGVVMNDAPIKGSAYYGHYGNYRD
jgi:capsular exopolysaccharide synthesis family protein